MKPFAVVALRHAGLITGGLGWTPDAFWAATPAEVATAWTGWLAAHGIEPPPAPLTRAELDALLARQTFQETHHG
jgi:hypothetical protein